MDYTVEEYFMLPQEGRFEKFLEHVRAKDGPLTEDEEEILDAEGGYLDDDCKVAKDYGLFSRKNK